MYHRFVVFSIVDDDLVIPKFVQCNNCGVIHYVTEIGRSTIKQGRDELRSAMSIDDIAQSLPERLATLLRSNDCQLHVWEHAKFIVDEARWGEHIIITSDNVDGVRTGKILVISGHDKFGLTQFSEQNGTT